MRYWVFPTLLILSSCGSQADVLAVKSKNNPSIQSTQSQKTFELEKLIRFDDAIKPEFIQSIMQDLGVKIIKKFQIKNLYHIQLPTSKNRELLKKLHDLPGLKYIESNVRYKKRSSR